MKINKIRKIENDNQSFWASHDELKEGDLAWTFNKKTKVKELKPIKKIILKKDSKFVKILSLNNYEQPVTESHNVLMNDMSFKKAKNIQIGDLLVDNLPVLEIEKIETKEQDVWCINTDNNTVYAKKGDKEFLTGNSQAPFSNVTLDLVVPEDLRLQNPVLGGRKMKFTYGDCQEEVNLFNRAFFEVFEAGDFKGNIFQYPIPTLNCTREFFETLDPQVEEAIYRLTAKFGSFYFSNFVNTEMKTSDVRSMCVHPKTMIDVELEEDYIEDDNGNFYTLSEAKNKGLI